MTSSQLELPEHPDAEGLRRYLELDQQGLVSLWTLQQPGAVQELRTAGLLCGSKRSVRNASGYFPGKVDAYRWAMEQASHRQGQIWSEPPIWASFHRSALSDRTGDILLHLLVPKSRMVAGFYKPWHDLLGIFRQIGELHWPNFWIFEEPYLDPFGEPRTDVLRPPPPPEALCRQSWAQMFDISLGLDPRFKWDRQLQALLRYVRVEDVVGEEPSLPLYPNAG